MSACRQCSADVDELVYPESQSVRERPPAYCPACAAAADAEHGAEALAQLREYRQAGESSGLASDIGQLPQGMYDRIRLAAEVKARDDFAAAISGQAKREAGPSLKSRLLDFKALMKLPPPKPLIKGVLELESESWLIGPPGGYKSFVAIDWACHVALGLPWREKATHAGPVLYVAAEGGKGIRKRVAAWAKHHGAEPEGLYVLPAPVQAKGQTDRWSDPTLSAEWRELVTLAVEIGAVMVILDTQARMTVGLEENSATAMGVWIEAVRTIKEATKAAIVCVHHTGRDGRNARGSSALDGAQDQEWKVVRRGEKSMVADLFCEKSKDGDDSGRFAFSMREIELDLLDDNGDPLTSLVLGDDAPVVTKGVGDVVSAVASIEAEGRTWNAAQWVKRMLAAQDKDGAGLTNSMLFKTINEARKEVSVDPMPLKTFNNNLSRLALTGELHRLNNGRTSVHDPCDAPPSKEALREEDEARDRGWMPQAGQESAPEDLSR